MKKFLHFTLLASIIFFIDFFSANAIDFYYVNPQGGSRYYKIVVDNIDVLVEPCGLFTSYKFEIEMHNGDSHWNNVQLELNWKFNLDDNDYMNDAWLWVGDTLVRADIMDKWTANTIYEGIVKRRQDPLLIMKNGNLYDTKLYPFLNNSPRTFIVKFMIPNNTIGSNVTSNFSFIKLFASNYNISYNKINLKFAKNNLSGEPTALDPLFKFKNFEEINGVIYLNYSYDFSTKKVPTNFGFNYSLNTKDNILVGLSPTGANEGYFQVLADMNMMNIDDNSEILFLLNYQANKTSLTKQNVIDGMKSYLRNYQGNNFKYNLLISNFNYTILSENWINSNDSLNIDSLFSIKNIQLSDVSMLPNLIIDGIEFLKNKGNNAKIILINCSDEFYSGITSNQFIEKILIDLPANTQFNVLCYQSKNFNTDASNPTLNKGNAYFYNILTKNTGGGYIKFESALPFSTFLDASLHNMINSFDFFDVKFAPTNGLSYHNYSYNSNRNVSSFNYNTIIGKYFGSFPIEIEILAIKNQKPYFKTITIASIDSIYEIDATEQIWYSNYLKELEIKVNTSDNIAIRQLVDLSIEKRILTNYTAFLALEPWMKKQNDTIYDEKNDNTNTDVDDIISTEISVATYPNPFTEKVKININNLNQAEIIESVIIYDELGNKIYEFELSNSFSDKVELIWKAENISKGIYLIKVKTNKRELISKIIKI